MTTNEYPKTCTRQEAIDCVKAGGTASAKGRQEHDTCWRNLVTVRGEVTHPNYSGIYFPFICDDRYWDYRIDAPAPVAQPDTYSTAEAITELYKHKPGEVEFVGDYGVYRGLTMFRGSDTNTRIRNHHGDLLDVIPNTRWICKRTKPAPLSIEVTVGAKWITDAPIHISNDFRRIRGQWPGKIRVTYTVEAVE